MKKIFLILCFVCISSAICFAQEETLEEATTTEKPRKETKSLFGSSFTPPKSAKEFWSQVSPFVNIGTNITINTADKTISAPSPASFALGVGAIWPNNAFVSFQPRLNIFTGYYLWNAADNYAYPAEVENRTAMALSFMFDFPAAATFRFEKYQFEVGAGVGLLARIALMANGVSENDFGSSGSAGSDKEKIKKWFWSDMRFLYPEIFAAWEYKFSEKLMLGFELRYYISMGALVSGRGLDASIIAVAAKFIF